MKRSRFTEEQIIGILREQEAGAKTADICRNHGISDATFYNWRAKYGGLDDGPVRERLRALAGERRRFGYRRLGLLLAREGIRMNRKKLLRLYREERLMVRKRGGRKRALGTRAPTALPQGPNQRWSLDFVSDPQTRGPSDGKSTPTTRRRSYDDAGATMASFFRPDMLIGSREIRANDVRRRRRDGH